MERNLFYSGKLSSDAIQPCLCFAKQLHIPVWGANIRMAIPAVILFWTPIEILGRMNLFEEIWTAPLEHKTEMFLIFSVFTALAVYLFRRSKK